MTTYFNRTRLENMIDEVAADPSRAEAVKRNLARLMVPKPAGRVFDRRDRPIVDCDDYFDNMPV